MMSAREQHQIIQQGLTALYQPPSFDRLLSTVLFHKKGPVHKALSRIEKSRSTFRKCRGTAFAP